MSLNPPLGYRTARQVIELGRGAFFADPEFDLPESKSPLISADDRLPQFGYVGLNYAPRRILFLGINPGNGHRAIRSQSDKEQMPLLQKFAAEPTLEHFLEIQRAFRSACQSWAIWGRECTELLATANLEIDDIAFSNALPWRTRSESGFVRDVERRTAANYLKPLLEELEPLIIVALGKKVQRVLVDAGSPVEKTIVWNRARALTPEVRKERENTKILLRNLLIR